MKLNLVAAASAGSMQAIQDGGIGDPTEAMKTILVSVLTGIIFPLISQWIMNWKKKPAEVKTIGV